MILERDERPLHRTPLAASLAVGLGCLTVSGALAVAHREPWLALGSLLALVGLLVSLLAHRQQLLTDRSLIEYSPVLAALARRFPRLARAEARRRRVVRLSDVLEAQRAGARILLRPRYGRVIDFRCPNEQEAANLLRSLEGLLRARGPHFRRAGEAGPPTPLAVRVTPAGGREEVASGGRCPYCHDEVPGEEAEACARCGAVHHGECLDVHGGCAAYACQGQPRAGRVRTGS